MLSLRAFKRAISFPMLFAIEVLVALIAINVVKKESGFWKFWLFRYNLLGMLFFGQIFIHRCRIFVNKVIYLVVSFVTAFKNKKQRIRSQWICVLL
jgi:hypothetical protein